MDDIREIINNRVFSRFILLASIHTKAEKSASLISSQVLAFVLGFINVKTWESLLLAYPKSQALALPLHQDKQLELAHAVIYCNRIQYTQRGRFGCVPSDEDSNLRDLRL